MSELDIISYSLAKKGIKLSGNVGEKEVDLAGLIDGNIIEYDSVSDKFIVKKNIAKVEQWKANHEYEKGEMFVFDDILWWSLSDFTSNNGSSPEIDEVNGLCMPFAKDLGFPNLIDLDYENKKMTFKCDFGEDHNFNISMELFQNRKQAKLKLCTICNTKYKA